MYSRTDGRPQFTIRVAEQVDNHDWTLSRAIIRRLDLPVFLAGGLDPTNVQDAITEVRPFGVDLCSSVRTNGALDPSKLTTFMTAVHLADESRGP